MHLISCLLKLVERDLTEREPFGRAAKSSTQHARLKASRSSCFRAVSRRRRAR